MRAPLNASCTIARRRAIRGLEMRPLTHHRLRVPYLDQEIPKAPQLPYFKNPSKARAAAQVRPSVSGLEHSRCAGDRHSITSSARASSIGGTSRPRVLAVLRLMTNSNLVGA